VSGRVTAPGRTRDRILDVALDLFAEHGFAGTPITAIEREVGLAAGTGSFHRHFRSKEEVLHAAVEREVARLLREIEEAPWVDADDPHEQRVRALERHLVDIRRFDRLFRLMLTEGDRLPDLRATFAKALGFGEGRPAWDAEVDEVVVVAALAGYHYLGLMQGRPFQGVPEGDFIDAVARLAPPGSDRRGRR
jgi:AcrR family transcriptional regulator